MVHFSTNRGISLGISEQQFIELSKKQKYKISSEGKNILYEFSFKVPKTSKYTGFNNEYLSVYTFEQGKLVYISIDCL